MEGRVVAVGKGHRHLAEIHRLDLAELTVETRAEEMQVKVGDLVMYGLYSGAEVMVDGERMVILRQDEILATIEESAETQAARAAGA